MKSIFFIFYFLIVAFLPSRGFCSWGNYEGLTYEELQAKYGGYKLSDIPDLLRGYVRRTRQEDPEFDRFFRIIGEYKPTRILGKFFNYPNEKAACLHELEGLGLDTGFIECAISDSSYRRLSLAFFIRYWTGEHLTSILNTLRHLKSLERLDLSHNNIETVPEGVLDLGNLQKLDLSHNILKNVPDISRLGRIKFLGLSHNQLSETPPAIGCLSLDERGNYSRS